MELFRVRLNCIDNYQATPTHFDPQLRSNVSPSQKHNEPKVPVIRVFGSTETGQKVCAHIHGAFPYLYIEYTGSLVPDEVGAYTHRLHLSIDHALAVSYRRNLYDGKNKFVARVTLVKGVPFYGYHVGYKFYMKIYMLNPMVMTRLADLLRQGAIMKASFQPYEAHLQYLLQFMADYNLYGCGYLDAKKAYFRAPVPAAADLAGTSHLWHDASIPPAYIMPETLLPRVSHCPIEVDISVQDIMNRADIKPRSLHHDFIERLNAVQSDEKLVQSMAGLWRDETKRRKIKLHGSDAGSSPFPTEVMIPMSADPRATRTLDDDWIHEAEHREQIAAQLQEERERSDGSEVNFRNVTRRTPFDSTVKTVLSSVEDLYPQNLAHALGLKYEQTQRGIEDEVANEDFEVDENRIFRFDVDDDDDEFPYDSDEEVMRELELSQRKKGDHVQEPHPANDPLTVAETQAEAGILGVGPPNMAGTDTTVEPDMGVAVEDSTSPTKTLNALSAPQTITKVIDQRDTGHVKAGNVVQADVNTQHSSIEADPLEPKWLPGKAEREYKGKKRMCIFMRRNGKCGKGRACGYLHADPTHSLSSTAPPGLAAEVRTSGIGDNIPETSQRNISNVEQLVCSSAFVESSRDENNATDAPCSEEHVSAIIPSDPILASTGGAKRRAPSNRESTMTEKRQKLSGLLETFATPALQRHETAPEETRTVDSVQDAATFPSSSAPPLVTINGVPKNTRKRISRNSIGNNFGFPIVKDAWRIPEKHEADLHEHAENNNITTSVDSEIGSNELNGCNSVSDMSASLPTASDEAPAQSFFATASIPLTSDPDTISAVLGDMMRRYPTQVNSVSHAVGELPPTSAQILANMADMGMPEMLYQNAFYSEESDVPDKARDWAGKDFRLESLTIPFLADFDSTGTSAATLGQKPRVVVDTDFHNKAEASYARRRQACHLKSWEIASMPPTYKDVSDWADAQEAIAEATEVKRLEEATAKMKFSQVDGPTQNNRFGAKYTQKQKTTSVKHEAQYMSIMSLEVHVNTRGAFVPNPEEDEVQCIFWCLQGEKDNIESNGRNEGTHVGIVVLAEDDGELSKRIESQTGFEVIAENSELDLIIRMVEIVREHDPDILTGYEVHGGSWGFLIERARLKYEYNLCDEFSRMLSQSHGRFGKDNDKWGFNNTSTIRVTGRHMINVWRAMRSELNLLQYTMENVAFHLLHKRIPHYSWKDLTTWYTNGRHADLAKVLEYYGSRVQIDLEILEQNELVPRTSEQARLLGVDFFSVFSRGSQFKVESLMFRIAKPENFMLVSPSRKQVGGQNALECLPLVMEPQSNFYPSPLLVLDFQSLYPSVMIAYNYCYSTFLGRVVNWRGTSKMGFTDYKRQQRMLELLKDHINIAPNGIMYVKPEIRKSLLAKMLGEILETRVMVKSGMKVDKDDKTLQRLLNNRQLALKLIANVTYGYTSASFSGRMPCSEIADSIVQTGRETLEKAIATIHETKEWDAEVVYGDTDSLFVYLPGRTKDQAFTIGEQIAAKITASQPRPIKLKFEKVYFPCVLLAKKRYVGFKYEHRDQKEPDFDAKGIETVRRDGTPAEQKIEEKALKILFRTADLSQVKSYFLSQCEKIMKGSVSIQDFCFAKEVKLGTYSENGLPPPGALISTKRMLADARAEPQYGERVPYVVITGAPGARLIDRCVAPETLLNSDHMELDADYYISKNLIPPLERIFNLVGANVRQWFDEMPKIHRIRRIDAMLPQGNARALTTIGKKTLESYMKSSSCLVCTCKLAPSSTSPPLPICSICLSSPPTSLLRSLNRLREIERSDLDLQKVCRSCSGIGWGEEVKCDSKDCAVFYTRVKSGQKVRRERGVAEEVGRILGEVERDDLEW